MYLDRAFHCLVFEYTISTNDIVRFLRLELDGNLKY